MLYLYFDYMYQKATILLCNSNCKRIDLDLLLQELFLSPKLIEHAFFIYGLEKRLVLTIEPNDYITKSGEDATVKLYVKGKVEETGQSFATQDVVELTKPKLKVTVSYGDQFPFVC